MKIIRSSKHTTRYMNLGKLQKLNSFVDEYRRVAQIYLDYLWDTPYIWTKDDKTYTLDIKRKLYNTPIYFDYNLLKVKTTLSARALSSLTTQLAGIISASVTKQRKRLWKVRSLLSQGKVPSKSLINSIRKNKPVKPYIADISPELSSKCCDLCEYQDRHFNAFLRLKSLGKSFGTILIPIKYTKHSNKLYSKYTLLKSFLINKNNIDFRYEAPAKLKSTGQIVGADQGLKDILTLSNGTTTPKTDCHGHSLGSITTKLSRKRKGSKSFGKAQDHRKNYINWSINQVDFGDIKQINFEEIININYKSRTSRYNSHWTNTLIRDKVCRKAEEQEVLVVTQPSAYYSQRCSCCGLVRKANRKGKQYTCKGCGTKIDSDLNAAKNHEQDLYYLGWALSRFIRKHRKNTGKGFYWNSIGVYEITGEEFGVPLSTNE